MCLVLLPDDDGVIHQVLYKCPWLLLADFCPSNRYFALATVHALLASGGAGDAHVYPPYRLGHKRPFMTPDKMASRKVS